MSSFFKRSPPHPDYDDDNDSSIDPELRLRTVRTAASAIAESIQTERRVERRKTRRKNASRFFRRGEKKAPSIAASSDSRPSSAKAHHGPRRNIYVNYPLSAAEVDSRGEPIARYSRNKVRTSKYTVFTFVPKNLYEQFRRVANLYFLGLVVLQVFPVFGAATGKIAFLPLAFIITVTAIKDGVEDYRRATLDEEVNCSAATKLGSWRNVNQHTDPRSRYEKLLGLNKPGRVTRGVRKLRDKEAGEGMRVILRRTGEIGDFDSVDTRTTSLGSPVSPIAGAGGRRLDDIQSMDSRDDSHVYPPGSFSDVVTSKTSLSTNMTNVKPDPEELGNWNQGTMSTYQQSTLSRVTVGVVDWNKRPGGAARWERTLWKKLEVGDIVLLRENEQVPADIVVLSTSDPDGMCYLETKNLDGETNLKPRKAVRGTSTITSEDDIERSSFLLDSEAPHQNLYLYHGVLRYKDPATGADKQETLSINELLLRGCAIRNTSWIIGLVVYTGADTKIMLNGGDTPSKRSKIEKETNFNVIVNFVVLLAMCIIGAIFSGVQDRRATTSAVFFEAGSDPTTNFVVNAIITFASCLIAFQNIVPISLYISIEIVKTIQAYFISQDIDMYSSIYDTPCVPKTWNISDDLGQIEYIFSDKTGTLTQNVMEFQKCSVAGMAYGEGITEAQRGAATRQGKVDMISPEDLNEKLDKLKADMISQMARTFKNRYMQRDRITLVSPKLADDLANRASDQRGRLIAFFRALAICHSVLADRPEPQKQPFHLEYKAESPDEAALVAAARDAGFPFVGRTKDSIDIEAMGQPERYVPLRMLEFNSTRKRMSVIVRSPEGRLILYCKGADSVIYERLTKDHDPELKAATQRDMEDFANSGLRTLCIAYRYLDEDEYMRWSIVYDAAISAVEDRDEAIDKANEMIEHSLVILGATALEDKLQEGVPEAIEMLHRAGIKLWILTGDKLQTAIEIGYSCNLLKSDMELMILSADGPDTTRSQIEAGLNRIAAVLGPPSWDPKKRGFVPGAQAAFAAVIDGDTLRHALSPELKPMFLNLGTQCETVVCCRVSPAQKALTVKLVKEGRDAMTLSIGDGANDVAMIQEANIGCGLFGLEGSQASMSADYAFGQFRFLTKLLLVHGRWSYQRIADMHSNFFYKNVIWTFAMFWFLPFNSFSATYLYQYTFILLYNTVFTSLPVIVLGAFDQDLNAKAALAFPQLYIRGIRGLEYSRSKFWLYMLDGLYQSAVVFFIPFLVWTVGLAVSWNGKTIDSLADFGTTVAVAAIFAANTFVGLNTQYWTIITWIVVFGSSVFMLLWVVIYSFIPSTDFDDEVIILFGELTFWTTVVFSVFVALAPRFIMKFISTAYNPLDKDIVREGWVHGDLKDRLGVRHRNNSKNKNKNKLANEAADNGEYMPMFHTPHARSGSDASLHQSYEPQRPSALTPSPSPALYLYTGQETNRSQPTNMSSSSSAPPDTTRLSPERSQSPERDLTPSPKPSYYSASEIRPPSPPPQPVYRFTTGEYTSTPPSGRQSVASRHARGSFDVFRSPLPPPATTVPNAAQLSDALRVAATAAGPTPGAYEMQVRSRSPPSALAYRSAQETRGVSEASYATAQDTWSEDFDDDRPASGYDNDTATVQPEYDTRRASSYSWDGGRAL